MGYYSNFSYYLESAKVDTKKVKELEEFFKNEDNHLDISGFLNVIIELDRDDDEIATITNISPEDNYAKFYDDWLMAKKLSSALVDGSVELYFVGEDGLSWGYRVTPGKVYDMVTTWVVAGESKFE
jgi:hypothetical protein